MEKWRATRPVDVARFNSRVFLMAARAYLVLFLVLLPVDVIGAMVVAHHRLPTFSTAHVLSITLPFFVTGFLSHATALLFVAMLLIAVGSLAWWRHVLAAGGPLAALAALASSTRRVVLHFAHRVDPGSPGLVTRRDQTVHAAPVHPLLDRAARSRCSTQPVSPHSKVRVGLRFHQPQRPTVQCGRRAPLSKRPHATRVA